MGLLKVGGRFAASSLGRFLFPPVCPGCQAATERADALCAQCWTGLSFIERPYCEVLGLPFSYDLGRGFLSAEAIADPPPFARLRAAVIYRDLAARLVASLKYNDRTDLVPLMAGWMSRAGAELIAEADVVVPVPLHARRLWRRRFNQSAELGHLIARNAKVPYAPRALLRVKQTRAQVGLGPAERRLNVRGAFAVPPERVGEINGRRVLLIDDVYTTGATVSSATRALKRAGARDVDVLAFARVAAGA
ncbi:MULTISPECIES: ComF family protein [unclassified Aureimonas]|uniref:ComF family protein n=1 Tax=unclassified Aureimonas TaxID=2615206 RepID=UPI0006FDFE89|nr:MULTISPECIES: ComF family protein [unclassified Aureimonas]KQT54005.1 amidophosphoribosyltransferase [Aureimonas sp. Leaf427]KQT71555.1 amidophosphoribosyltransferase [Aureimonas sp. Leaf460]